MYNDFKDKTNLTHYLIPYIYKTSRIKLVNDNSYLKILKENGHTNVNTNVNTNTTSFNSNNLNFFIPKLDESYYYVSAWNMQIFDDTRTDEDTDEIFMLNKVFRNREGAEKYLKFLQAEARLQLAMLKMNNGWTPDWSNGTLKKYYIYAAIDDKILYTSSCYKVKYSKDYSIYYFETSQNALRFKENYKEDLFIYFGINNG